MASFYLRELILFSMDSDRASEFEFREEEKKLKMILATDFLFVLKQRKAKKKLREN